MCFKIEKWRRGSPAGGISTEQMQNRITQSNGRVRLNSRFQRSRARWYDSSGRGLRAPGLTALGLSVLMLGGAPAMVQAAEGTDDLVLDSAWVRAMPPGRPMTAAYLRVRNLSDAPISVSSVSSSRGSASMHESREVDGRMQMREVPELMVPARGTANLEPGGLHIMVMALEATPVEGESLTLCLATTSGEVCTEAPVRRRPPSTTDSGAGATMPDHSGP